jgi:hypothetical protein
MKAILFWMGLLIITKLFLNMFINTNCKILRLGSVIFEWWILNHFVKKDWKIFGIMWNFPSLYLFVTQQIAMTTQTYYYWKYDCDHHVCYFNQHWIRFINLFFWNFMHGSISHVENHKAIIYIVSWFYSWFIF